MEPNIYATNTSCVEMDPTTVVYCELHKIDEVQKLMQW